jgi:hypothetical protein
MKQTELFWGKKKHDRTILSAALYWLTKMAYRLAPEKVARFARENGFKIKPYALSEMQQALLAKAHRFDLEFNQNKIRVYEWGSGPVILLVHGWSGRALQLDSFIEPLLAMGYQVVAFDHKGHGDSSSTFSSYPEFVRGTMLVSEHYEAELYGVVAHSIGSNSAFKVSENFSRPLKMVAVAPMERFMEVLEKMRMQIGIDEHLFDGVIKQIERDSRVCLADVCQLDYDKIKRHNILLVHDKFDRMNKISGSYEIQKNLMDTDLHETEMLGHSRILSNPGVVDRVVAHFRPQA